MPDRESSIDEIEQEAAKVVGAQVQSRKEHEVQERFARREMRTGLGHWNREGHVGVRIECTAHLIRGPARIEHGLSDICFANTLEQGFSRKEFEVLCCRCHVRPPAGVFDRIAIRSPMLVTFDNL